MGASERTTLSSAAGAVAPDGGRESPRSRLGRLMDGYLSTQLLVIAAELGVADALADGPRSSADLARTLGAEPVALHRVLRGLAADGVLGEQPDGCFELTPTGRLLHDGGDGSQRGAVLARGRLYYTAVGGLLDAVRSGGTAFERHHGTPFFEFLAARPDRAAAFQASMTDRSRHEAAVVVAAYDFAGIRRLVDVGGGRGVLLEAVLAATPGLTGVLFDRPEVAQTAAAADGRWTVAGGDFFEAVPAGGDAYLLSRVIHDWDDAAAVRILANCHRVVPRGGRLLLVEAVLPERAADGPEATRMDLHMLTLVGGRERTEAEYRSLLSAAGFAVARVVPTASPTGIAVVEAVPVAGGTATPGGRAAPPGSGRAGPPASGPRRPRPRRR